MPPTMAACCCLLLLSRESQKCVKSPTSRGAFWDLGLNIWGAIIPLSGCRAHCFLLSLFIPHLSYFHSLPLSMSVSPPTSLFCSSFKILVIQYPTPPFVCSIAHQGLRQHSSAKKLDTINANSAVMWYQQKHNFLFITLLLCRQGTRGGELRLTLFLKCRSPCEKGVSWILHCSCAQHIVHMFVQ